MFKISFSNNKGRRQEAEGRNGSGFPTYPSFVTLEHLD
jgi:hypothetical protein